VPIKFLGILFLLKLIIGCGKVGLSDVIALHRQDQQSTFLRYFGEQTLKLGSVDLAIADLLKKAA
jgi:hypothetical protein